MHGMADVLTNGKKNPKENKIKGKKKNYEKSLVELNDKNMEQKAWDVFARKTH